MDKNRSCFRILSRVLIISDAARSRPSSSTSSGGDRFVLDAVSGCLRAAINPIIERECPEDDGGEILRSTNGTMEPALDISVDAFESFRGEEGLSGAWKPFMAIGWSINSFEFAVTRKAVLSVEGPRQIWMMSSCIHVRLQVPSDSGYLPSGAQYKLRGEHLTRGPHKEGVRAPGLASISKSLVLRFRKMN